ncbi:MAG: type II toxin-antitoxin system Phd/YefM family antitoxin [Acidobacteria bacterium]|nr:type II toxin-antitoxin system Phd/YefM family antitoxin [Acidobacteriota bacterium]
MAKLAARTVRHLSIAEASASLSKIARRAHDKGEYFFVKSNGAPTIGIMDAEELEDYLELRDPRVQSEIQKSNEEYLAGKSRPLEEFLAGLPAAAKKKSTSRRSPRA